MYTMEAYKKITLEEMSKFFDADELEKMVGDILQIAEEGSTLDESVLKLRAYFKDKHDFEMAPKTVDFVIGCWDCSTGPTTEDHYRNFLRLAKIFVTGFAS